MKPDFYIGVEFASKIWHLFFLRLRDLKPTKPASKLETVVERVIRLREEQNLGNSQNNSDESKTKRENEKVKSNEIEWIIAALI